MKVARFVVFTVSCAALVAVFVTMTPSWSRVACGMPTWLLMGAALADAITPLGLLNFLVLQWFGVRLVRVREALTTDAFDDCEIGLRIDTADSIGRRQRWKIVGVWASTVFLERYSTLRWIIPLTGWWTDYRYIARKS